MIRPTTLGLLAVAVVAGGSLFHVSDGARALKDELKSLDRQFAADTDEMHVLRAEWSYLNQPARLEELARRHLGLEPLTGAQVIRLEMLPLRERPAAAPIAAPTPPKLAVIEAVVVAPPPAKISSRLRTIAVIPRPKPAAPVRGVPRPAPRAADRSLEDVLAELLSPAPGNAQ